MPSKKKRVLLARALPWNVLSGNVSSPSIMKIPLRYDLLEFFVWVVAAPVVLPAFMLRSVAEAVEEQARYETDVESMLRNELPENEMRYESGEIIEEVYRTRKVYLTKRLEEFEK